MSRYRRLVDEFKGHLICEALMRSGGRQTVAAKELGIHRNVMLQGMKSLGIDKNNYSAWKFKARSEKPRKHSDRYAMSDAEWNRAKRPATSVTLLNLSAGVSNT